MRCLLLVAVALLVAAQLASAAALYTANDHVVELTAANFQAEVIDSSDVWMVEFYAPWCGHWSDNTHQCTAHSGAAQARQRGHSERRDLTLDTQSTVWARGSRDGC